MCFFKRKLLPNETPCLDKRKTELAIIFATEHFGGHRFPPIFSSLSWDKYTWCILHALMSMGRVFVKALHNRLVDLVKSTDSDIWWTYINSWLKYVGVQKLNLEKPPEKGSWSVKGKIQIYLNYSFESGIHTAKLWKGFKMIAEKLGIVIKNVLKTENILQVFCKNICKL